MDITKVILRKSGFEPGQLLERVNYIRIGDDMENPKVQALAAEYKDFKVKHPQRWARLPPKFKGEAQALLESGVSLETIAKACGTGPTTIRAWVEPKKSKKANLVKELSAAQLIGTSQPLEQKPKAAVQASLFRQDRDKPMVVSSGERTWVRVRVFGTELEIAEADLVKFLKVLH